ncbi:hypothetical protein MVEN_00793400 [Mycena venus]|uniref:Transmembrane protein n=1 Tax=Mycena venus TaxID=2733690 RepID=A0A8H6YKA7_9AGAR|nr:hypothetical protein MVEN_00793400 [Mycena venus]
MSQYYGSLEGSLDSLALRPKGFAFVSAGSTAVLVWDMLNNLADDYSLVFRRKLSLATAAYVASRLGSLIYLLGFTIFATYPIRACSAAFLAFNSFYPVSISATTFLFFSRVRAIYGGERMATIIFGFLWLSVAGSSTTVPIAGRAANSPDTSECILTHSSPYAGSSGIILTVYDTVIFLAISYRLVSTFAYIEPGLTRVEKLRIFFDGSNLPAFSKALLTDGQIYYLITVISNIATIVVMFHGGYLIVPNVGLTSIMACRVYRNTKPMEMPGSAERPMPTLNSLSASGNYNASLSMVQLGATRTNHNPLSKSPLDIHLP